MGGYRAVIFRDFSIIFRCKKPSSFLLPKSRKKPWFGEAKMVPKIGFFELWRALVSDRNFSIFFFNFVALGLGTFVKDF